MEYRQVICGLLVKIRTLPHIIQDKVLIILTPEGRQDLYLLPLLSQDQVDKIHSVYNANMGHALALVNRKHKNLHNSIMLLKLLNTDPSLDLVLQRLRDLVLLQRLQDQSLDLVLLFQDHVLAVLELSADAVQGELKRAVSTVNLRLDIGNYLVFLNTA